MPPTGRWRDRLASESDTCGPRSTGSSQPATLMRRCRSRRAWPGCGSSTGDFAEGARRLVRQGPVQHRLPRRAADLPRRGAHAVRARPDRALPETHLRGLPAAGPLHRQARPGAASPSTPTRRCSPSSANARPPPKAARSYASASRSSTPSPTSATGKAAGHATAAPARTSSTCAASPSSTTSTSSPASPPPATTS